MEKWKAWCVFRFFFWCSGVILCFSLTWNWPWIHQHLIQNACGKLIYVPNARCAAGFKRSCPKIVASWVSTSQICFKVAEKWTISFWLSSWLDTVAPGFHPATQRCRAPHQHKGSSPLHQPVQWPFFAPWAHVTWHPRVFLYTWPPWFPMISSNHGRVSYISWGLQLVLKLLHQGTAVGETYGRIGTCYALDYQNMGFYWNMEDVVWISIWKYGIIGT